MSKRKRTSQADGATPAIDSLCEDAVVKVTTVSSPGLARLVALIPCLCARRDRMTTRDACVLGARSLTG